MTVKRTKEDDYYIDYEEQRDELNGFLDGYFQGETESAVVNIIGSAGVGKSNFLIRRCEDYQKSGRNVVYVEVSACKNEVEIMKMLVDQIRGIAPSDFPFKKFLFIYDWFYGEYATAPKAGLTEYDKLEEAQTSKLMTDLKKLAKGEVWDILPKVFTGIVGDPISLVSKVVEALWTTLSADAKKQKGLDILSEVSGRLESEWSRRRVLKDFFISECKEGISGKNSYQHNMVIVIDNFCIDSHTDLLRNMDWLTGRDGILREIPAAWLIGSRREFAFHVDGREIGRVEIHGFSEKEARDYLAIKCQIKEEEKEEAEQQQEQQREITADIIRKILDTCVEIVGPAEGGEIYYSPYKMNIATNHYNRLKDQNGVSGIKLRDFVDDIQSDAQFVSDYFYMDLPDHLLNAVQILSCMSTWNHDRLKIIQGRFNDLLLNTKYLLRNSVSIEEIDEDNFKLHEAIKDALYQNERNIIKRDVQEFIFEEYTNLFLAGQADESIMRDFKIFQVYVQLSQDYLEFQKDKEKEQHETIINKLYNFEKIQENSSDKLEGQYWKFFEGLKKICNANKAKEFVEWEFAEFFENTIEEAKKLINRDGDGTPSPYYIELKLECADLYTNLSIPEKAKDIEEQCVMWARALYEEAEVRQQSKYILFASEKLLLRCRNAYAYDLSFHWDYKGAYHAGQKGLEEAAQFVCTSEDAPDGSTVIGHLLMKLHPEDKNEKAGQELTQSLLLLNQIYKDDSLSIDSREFPDDSPVKFQDLVQAYSVLLKQGINEEDSETKSVIRVLFDILFYNWNNLRGNFPWYIIKDQEAGWQEDQIIKYAVKTYLLRKAQNFALLELQEAKEYDPYRKDCYSKCLRAYHNIAVYAFKLGDIEKAYYIGNEVCFRRMQCYGVFDLERLDGRKKRRLREVREGTDAHCISRIKNVLNVFMEGHLREHTETLESIQYLGNYCFSKGDYELAKDKLGEVYLNLYIRQGISQSKTMECGIRLAVAIYALQEYDLAKSIAEDICREAEAVLNFGVTKERLDHYKTARDAIAGNIQEASVIMEALG